MSTINPPAIRNDIDDTKPVTATPLTASVRANETATSQAVEDIRIQLGNAKTDVEGLEGGKEDAGVAAGLVAAHEALGNPHADSASLTDFTNHKLGGTGEHPSFTAAQAGFAPASGGGTLNFLRADGVWAAPPGGGGGEANDGANVGATGEGVYRDKIGATLNFKKLLSPSGTIVVSPVGGDQVGFEVGSVVARRNADNTFVGTQTFNGNTLLLGFMQHQFEDDGMADVGAIYGNAGQLRITGGGTAAGISVENTSGLSLIPTTGVSVGSVVKQGAGTLAAQNGLYDGTSRVLSKDRAETIGDVGFELTPKQLASGGSFKPEPLDRNIVYLTGTNTTEIVSMTELGPAELWVENGTTLNITGVYDELNNPPTGRRYGVIFRNLGPFATITYI